ncbi:MAG: transposase family protein [Candidatus Moranbacteria bacterium]|nr:transposase family protein [Candidatus Moranbacteria bacterium]
MIHDRAAGKILKSEGLVRTYLIRKVKTMYVKMPPQPGELVEIDVKYVPGTIEDKAYFQYTAIDCASRWRYLLAYEEMNIGNSIRFLESVISVFLHRIRSVKTDNGSTFTNYYLGTSKRSDMTVKTIYAFDIFCRNQEIIHHPIDPGKPARNGKVERSHREDQEKFYEQNVHFVSGRAKKDEAMEYVLQRSGTLQIGRKKSERIPERIQINRSAKCVHLKQKIPQQTETMLSQRSRDIQTI